SSEATLEELDAAFLEAAIETQVVAIRLAVSYWRLGKIANRIKDTIDRANRGRKRKDRVQWLPHLEELTDRSGLGTTTPRTSVRLARRLDREDVEGLTFAEAQRLAGIVASDTEEFKDEQPPPSDKRGAKKDESASEGEDDSQEEETSKGGGGE